MPNPDFVVTPMGTLWVFTVLTDNAREWVDEHVDVPDYHRFGETSFAADHRAARDLAGGISEAGFDLRWNVRGG